MSLIIDGKDAVLGRLSTAVAKELMKGTEVSIVNAQDIIITGDPKKLKERYLNRRRIGSPHHGPFFPTQPHAIVRRTIRGMLPYKTNKGRSAFKNLRVHTHIPEELQNKEMKKIAAKQVKTKFIRIGTIAKSIGWNES